MSEESFDFGRPTILANGVTIDRVLVKKSGPITVKELAERGMDDRLAEVLHGIIGEHLTVKDPNVVLHPDEIVALGYGPPCPCGERGLRIGEKVCSNCDRCKECCDTEQCSCVGCTCKP